MKKIWKTAGITIADAILALKAIGGMNPTGIQTEIMQPPEPMLTTMAGSAWRK